jgi:hypothetical protein
MLSILPICNRYEKYGRGYCYLAFLRKNLFRFLKIPPGFPGNHLGKRLVEMGKKRFLNWGKWFSEGGKWISGGGRVVSGIRGGGSEMLGNDKWQW